MPTTRMFGTYRFWDSGGRWAPQNPSYGNYSFSWMDLTADQAASYGVGQFIYTFGDVPQWASTNPNGTGCDFNNGGCYMPFTGDFTAFVSALARHSAARKAAGKLGITMYEMWNEPNATNYWRGTTSQMVQLAAAAYAIIHQYDPSAQVASPAPQGMYAYQWLQGYFAAGGAAYTDAVNFHGYVGTRPAESGINNVNQIKSLRAQYGLWGRSLNDTESSWWGYTGTTATAWMARKHLLDASQGVSMLVWYGWTFGASIAYTSNATVYMQICKWLVGHTVYPVKVMGSVYQVPMTGANGWSAVAAWNASGSSWLPVSSSYHHYTDLWGGVHTISGGGVSISTLPVLISY
jgi:polysaccharide biosynthesis protein PslG